MLLILFLFLPMNDAHTNVTEFFKDPLKTSINLRVFFCMDVFFSLCHFVLSECLGLPG